MKTYKEFITEAKKEQENLEEGWIADAFSTWLDVQTIEVLGTTAGLVLAAAGILANSGFNKIKNFIRKLSKNKEEREYEEMIKKIAKRFETDMKLKKMYENTPPYDAASNNARRNLELRKIARYIKAKLTDEEKRFFTDISKEIRGWKL